MDIITPDSVLSYSGEIVSREIEGELIIVPITSGIGDMEDELYSLNDTGRAIWTEIDGIRPVRDIADDLTNRYNAPVDQIITDILGLAGELVSRKILLVRQ